MHFSRVYQKRNKKEQREREREGEQQHNMHSERETAHK